MNWKPGMASASARANFHAFTVRLSRFALLVIAALTLTSIQVAIAQDAAMQLADAVAIHGTVVNAEGEPVKDALVRMVQPGTAGAIETKSDVAGLFSFSARRNVSYTISAEKSGRHSSAASIVASSAGSDKPIVLTLEGSGAIRPQSGTSQSSTIAPMEFADKVSFSVAGVTDWTAVGGHGSDSSLRTSEDLARETAALKSKTPEPAATESTSRSREYELALASQAAGDLQQAQKQVHALLARETSADALRLAGSLDERLGDSLTAVHELEQAVRLDPSEPNVFEWGSELLLHRAVWQAQEVFEKGAATYPNSARMLTALGAALFAGARYDDAARRLCEASDLNPAGSEPYIFMGKIEVAAPNPLACVEQKLHRFAEQQPYNSLANYFYAMAILKQRETPNEHAVQQAETLLTKAAAIDPTCSDAYLQLGILSSSRHDLEKAIALYTKAIEANPKSSEAHYRLGVAFDRTGKPEKATQEFQLHDEMKRQDAEAIERQRREVKQFLVVVEGKPAYPAAN